MPKRDRTAFEEVVGWPSWVKVLIGVGVVVLFVAAQNFPARQVMIVGGPMVGVLALVWLLFGELVIRVHDDAITVGFGPLGVIRKRIAFDEIDTIEVVKYSPLLEFGGWGIKWGGGSKVAWTMRGNRALVLHMKDGKHIYVGSEQPQRLEERLHQLARERIKGSRPRDW